MNDIDHERDERSRAVFPARTPERAAKHRSRAVEALAKHRCSTDLTDGFCSPRDARCQQRAMHRDCMKQAEWLMRAMENVGCTVVWAFDREMGGQP